MKPRIAIPVPTANDPGYNLRSWPAYARAVELSGGKAVEVPLNLAGQEVKELLAECEGFCLPGSPADVDSALYGMKRDPATAQPDRAREAVDREVLEHAEKHGKPVLAICFGVQFLNVWRGGTLVQNLLPVPVNHSAGGSVAIAHTAIVKRDSLLGSLIDPAEAAIDGEFLRLPINTSHHQAIAIPGDELRVVARCPEDGVIEAVEFGEHNGMFHVEHRPFVVGVQWHPERSYDISPTSRALFARLVEEAREPAEVHGAWAGGPVSA